jgi:hypothetical protein
VFFILLLKRCDAIRIKNGDKLRNYFVKKIKGEVSGGYKGEKREKRKGARKKEGEEE